MADAENQKNREQMAAEHEAICAMYGFRKNLENRGVAPIEKPRIGIRSIVVWVVTVAVLMGCVGAWYGFQYLIDRQEEARFIAEHDRQIANELARRNRIEYADIAFLDSFPPLVAISMDGKPLYARTKDGSYTELRARESTWIQNLPIREDTVLHFGFSAEGFKSLTRKIAYYDWFPTNKAGANPLQKVFRRVVLEPDVTPRLTSCATAEKIGDADPCEWTVFREIAFRDRYAAAEKGFTLDEARQRNALRSTLFVHPSLMEAATGYSLAMLELAKEIVPDNLPDATKNLIRTLARHPYALYGRLTLETDTPDTRVFFMGEPLMVLKNNGSLAQVKIQPSEPYAFSVFGQGRPIDISETLSVRLEADNAPAFVTEIKPHQWHCDVDEANLANVDIPDFARNDPDLRHYVCDYAMKISVDFKAIRDIEKEAALQRMKSTPTPENDDTKSPSDR